MSKINLVRKFKHGDKVLDDPNTTMTPSEVMDLYSEQYPELLNAKIVGPDIDNDTATYNFKSIIGPKG